VLNIPAIAQVNANELPRQGFLGTTVTPLPDEQRAQLKLPAEQGIVVTRVEAGSSAETVGLKHADIILKVGDTNVNSAPNFVNLIRLLRAGQTIALTVLRDGKRQNINVMLKARPLEINPDFDVLYRQIDTKGGRRRVIVTKPKKGGKLPAVVLVGGIGCYSLDNVPPTHAYRNILYGLTNQGFITMRVEKTGMGDSEGAACNAPQSDLRQEIEGYTSGLRALKTYDFVDADKVFIFGHSIGGIVGPAVAAEEKVRGLIVVATVGTNWYEYALENYRRQAVLRGNSYDQIETVARLNQICKRRLWVEREPREQILKEFPSCADLLQDPAPASYMQQLTDLNLAEMWKKVNAPVLIIYGASDFLTSAKEHEYLRDMINKFHPGKAKYIEIAAMDHYFERAATQRESMQRRGNPTQAQPQFVEQALTEISNWLKGNLNSSQASTKLLTGSAGAKVSAAEFQNLSWIEGDWHGTENGKNDFYERHRFAGEDRIEMQSFTDQEMTKIGTEKSSTFLKDNVIYHQAGRGVWIAGRFSKSEIRFALKFII
jgi:pimeloyl-ACP methyl ester carboxylesterase